MRERATRAKFNNAAAAAAEGDEPWPEQQQQEGAEGQGGTARYAHASSADVFVTPPRQRVSSSFYTRFYNVQLGREGITFFVPPGEVVCLPPLLPATHAVPS